MTRNVLIITGSRTHPAQTGGQLHTSGIAKSLARLGYSVRMFALAGRQEDYRGTQTDQRHQLIETGLVEDINPALGYGLLQAGFRRLGLPRFWQYLLMKLGWASAPLRTAVREADLVLCDHPYIPPLGRSGADKPWYLISHELQYRQLEQGPPMERRFAAWMRAVEAKAPSTYRDIMAVSEEDQDYFRRHDVAHRCRLPIVGSAIDPKDYQTPAGTRDFVRARLGVTDEELLVVFAGSKFGPNLDALATVKAFCTAEEAFLKQEGIVFLLLGSMESSAYRQGAMIATGRVDTIPPYFAASDVGLNPVTWGAGANVKLFEYLATRLPVLSTRFGVRGTELKAGADYVEYGSSEELKTALVDLARGRSRAEWRRFAEDVWQRHKHYADMLEVVRRATDQLRDFK